MSAYKLSKVFVAFKYPASKSDNPDNKNVGKRKTTTRQQTE